MARKKFKNKRSDLTTIISSVIAFSLVLAAIYAGGNPKGFINSSAILIVVFGTLAVTASCFSISEFFKAIPTAASLVLYKSEELTRAAIRSLEVAEIARNKGNLALENYDNLINHNVFFKDGINMVIDNVSTGEIELALKHEIAALAEKNENAIAILRKCAEVSPAMGLIGTLIGLIQMLGNLNDPSNIGPAMAVALLTTFYGAILSYMFFSPIASKIERNTSADLMVANIYHLAVQSISKGENPRQLELMINSILPQSKRIKYFESKREERQTGTQTENINNNIAKDNSAS